MSRVQPRLDGRFLHTLADSLPANVEEGFPAAFAGIDARFPRLSTRSAGMGASPDKGMYFIWDFTQLNVRPHSRVGLLKYKTAPKCSLSGPFRHSGVGRNPGAVGPVRSYNLNFTYPCQGGLPPSLAFVARHLLSEGDELTLCR